MIHTSNVILHLQAFTNNVGIVDTYESELIRSLSLKHTLFGYSTDTRQTQYQTKYTHIRDCFASIYVKNLKKIGVAKSIDLILRNAEVLPDETTLISRQSSTLRKARTTGVFRLHLLDETAFFGKQGTISKEELYNQYVLSQ
jgi:hypothetical protein